VRTLPIAHARTYAETFGVAPAVSFARTKTFAITFTATPAQTPARTIARTVVNFILLRGKPRRSGRGWIALT